MEFLLILLLLLLNGVFAMYEIALVSASKTRLETLVARGSKRATTVLAQLEEPEKFLSTIQIGITLIGILSGAFGGVAIADDLAPLIARIPAAAPYAANLALVITVATITYLSLIVGELVPKSIALSNPERYALALAPAMRLLTVASFPFVWLLSISTRLIGRAIGLETTERPMTREELKRLLNQSAEQGVMALEETEMMSDLFRFAHKRANELMTHRRDLAVMHPAMTATQALAVVEARHFSNYLLVEEHSDEPLGVVAVKEMLLLIGSKKPFDLRAIARQPLFVPDSLHANKVLELFKKQKRKFAVVVTEYGTLEGIVTLHDLTESVFGDILEENETDPAPIVNRHDGSMLVEGAMNVGDFMDQLAIDAYADSQPEGFTTLGGLAMYCMGRIPREGDRFVYHKLRFEVVDMDGSRVDKLLVTP